MLHPLYVKTHSDLRDRYRRWVRVLKKKIRHSNLLLVEISIKNRFWISEAERSVTQNKAGVRDLNKYFVSYVGFVLRST